MSLIDKLCQWCSACLLKLSQRLNCGIVNPPKLVNIEGFPELARRWREPFVLAPRQGKHYGTRVMNADGQEFIFWEADGALSEREKAWLGDFTTHEDWKCDSHWESEADLQAALEFIALAKIVANAPR